MAITTVSAEQSRNARTREKAAGFLLLFSALTAFTSLALAVQGTIDARRRHEILTNWPTANATIKSCKLGVHSPLLRRGDSYAYWVYCDVQYSVNGQEVACRMKSLPREAGRDGSSYTLSGWRMVATYPQMELNAWLRRHKPRSTLAIRYNPAAPASATFIGADPVVDIDIGPGSLQGVALFGFLALALWAFRRHLLKERA